MPDLCVCGHSAGDHLADGCVLCTCDDFEPAEDGDETPEVVFD